MPKDLDKRKWCVYQFEVKGIPFYVGIGAHKARAADRMRWVCAQIKRELADKPVKKPTLSSSVIKLLILTPEKIDVRYPRECVTRAEALLAEKQIITDLLATGHLLANVQHNRQPLPSASEVVRFVLRKSK